MNKVIKEKWITALRDGSYKQGKYVLRDIDNRFCCLGVLADLAGVEWQLSGIEGEGCYLQPADEHYDGNEFVANVLTSKQLREFGLSDIQGDLIVANDDKGWNFGQIAQYIEERVPIE